MSGSTVTPDGKRAANGPGWWFRALATDYDGTLTEAGPPSAEVLASLRAFRESGRKVVLVTGRILEDLHGVFPDVHDHVDVVVAENGAVLADKRRHRLLTTPVDSALVEALRTLGVPLRVGQVLVALKAEHFIAAATEVRRLGLDCQLVANRTELMILPSGVSKGTGVRAGLAELGISTHNAVGIGDAENDHSLLRVCEVGAAVGNAVPSLRRTADVVLANSNCAGVQELLAGPLVNNGSRPLALRWATDLGLSENGAAVRLSATGLNLLIAGPPTSGKSFVAGLVAEQLIQLGYSVLLIDPEGDYTELARLPSVAVIGGAGPPPRPPELFSLLDDRSGSVVVDLSLRPLEEQQRFFEEVPQAVEAHRSKFGVPHWILVDEAHKTLGERGPIQPFYHRQRKGYCLVTYRPDELAADVSASLDAAILLPGSHPNPAVVDLAGGDEATLSDRLRGLSMGEAVVVHEGIHRVQLIPRHTIHIRHRHKYERSSLPIDRRFYFRQDSENLLGVTAANLHEFHDTLTDCDPAVIVHHASRHDFSRWVESVFADALMAADLRRIEDVLVERPAAHDQVRHRLLAALERRYLS